MNVITISTYPSMPWRFRVQGPTGRRGAISGRDCNNAGEAAAVAIDWARNLVGPYCIVGHDKAMAMIPPEIRTRTA